MRSHQTSLQNVKKPAEECFFLRSYRVADCSFTKNKTPSQVFFTIGSKISGSLWQNMLRL